MKMSQALGSQLGLASLQRPRYSPGLLLEDEDLTAGVDYSRDLNRLLFRSLFGCGVICGLKVTAEPECQHRKLIISVDKGLGLDCMGNPIHVTTPVSLHYDPDCMPFPPVIWVTACYVEKACRPRDVSCGCDDGGHEAQVERTRIRDGYEIKLYDSYPECACSCEEPPKKGPPHTEGCCAGTDPQAGVALDANATTSQGGESETTPKPAPGCFDDHNMGVCECDCGCNCVLIGKVVIDAGSDGRVINSVEVNIGDVRFIRPVLTGQARRQKYLDDLITPQT